MEKHFPTADMEEYFRSLPESIQEQIMQSGVQFPSADAMRAVVMRLIDQYSL